MTKPLASTEVFPAMVVSMIEVGEETGALPEMLDRIAKQYEEEVDNAVEAMKRGALDYLTKPFGIAEVKALARKALENRALRQEVRELRREVNRQTVPGDRLVGRSLALLEVFKNIGRVAPRDVSVLITGESGTV